MDFFGQQDRAKTNTKKLVALFCFAVAAIIGAIFALLSFLAEGRSEFKSIAWTPEFALQISLFVGILVGLSSLVRISQLKGGGKVIAEALGGRKINHQTQSPNHRRILNVVSEMAIASGTPVPPVYLMKEDGINAFAAGFSPSDAVIGITQGCSEKLSRDQLQGVVAHEFSHILNGDMRLNIRLTGIIYGITCLSDIGRGLMRATRHSSRRNSKGNDGAAAIALAGMAFFLIGLIGSYFGSLIRAAVSRQREFLADAAAVQFTRNPAGIAGALKRIGGFTKGSGIKHSATSEFSHLFFTSALSSHFATHPPLEDRITRLDPHWKYKYPKTDQIQEEADALVEGISPLEATASFSGSDPKSSASELPPDSETSQKPSKENLKAALDLPGEKEVKQAVHLLSSLPPELLGLAREPHGACSVVSGVLLHPKDSVRERQVSILQSLGEAGVPEESLHAKPRLDPLTCEQKLALLEECMGSLNQLSDLQLKKFRKLTEELINADNQVDLFEWTLHKIIEDFMIRKLSPHTPLHGNVSLRRRLPECSTALGALAHFGQENEDPLPAYEKGFRALNRKRPVSLPPLKKCGLEQLDKALVRLTQMTPLAKRSFFEACLKTIEYDGKKTGIELQILRGLAAALSCPLRLFKISDQESSKSS